MGAFSPEETCVFAQTMCAAMDLARRVPGLVTVQEKPMWLLEEKEEAEAIENAEARLEGLTTLCSDEYCGHTVDMAEFRCTEIECAALDADTVKADTGYYVDGPAEAP